MDANFGREIIVNEIGGVVTAVILTAVGLIWRFVIQGRIGKQKNDDLPLYSPDYQPPRVIDDAGSTYDPSRHKTMPSMRAPLRTDEGAYTVPPPQPSPARPAPRVEDVPEKPKRQPAASSNDAAYAAAAGLGAIVLWDTLGIFTYVLVALAFFFGIKALRQPGSNKVLAWVGIGSAALYLLAVCGLAFYAYSLYSDVYMQPGYDWSWWGW